MKTCILACLVLLVAATVSEAQTVVVNFDSPAPSASPGTMPSSYAGITFGPNWSWEGAWMIDGTNNIYFTSASSNTQSFGFVQPEIFVSVQVFGDATGTLTLADDQGQTTTFQVAQTNVMYTVKTGWTKASKTVAVTYSQNWHLAFDNFTYQSPASAPAPAPSTAPSLTASLTLHWDDNTPVTGSVLVRQIVGTQQNVLGQFPLSSSGTANGALPIDFTQPSPLAFQLVLLNSSGVQVGDALTLALPTVLIPKTATGVNAQVVLAKATNLIKTFNVSLTP